MKNSLLQFSFVLILASLVIQSCNDGSMNYQPKGDYISGWAIFMDTNYVRNSGYYAVALYSNQNSAFYYKPLTTEIIKPDSTNMVYYRIDWKGEGHCLGAIIWMSDSLCTNRPIVLGTYGCDTTHNCLNNEPIPFPNFTGANYNILCWADTTRRLY